MTEERNPYAAPASRVVTAPPPVEVDLAGTVLAEPPHARSAGEGGAWISEGWQLFRRRPLQLVVMGLVYFMLAMVVALLLGLLPVVGGIISMAFNTLFISGLVIAIDRSYRGEEVSFDQLFEGFRHPARTQLALLGILLGVLYLLVGVLAAVLAGAMPFWEAATGLSGEDPGALLANGGIDWMPVLLMGVYALLLMVPLTMAMWFATALVLFNGVGPLAALGYSFRACLRNILPLTVYSLLFGLFFVGSIFTLFLAWVVLFPLMMTSWYIGYRRTCTEWVATTTA